MKNKPNQLDFAELISRHIQTFEHMLAEIRKREFKEANLEKCMKRAGENRKSVSLADSSHPYRHPSDPYDDFKTELLRSVAKAQGVAFYLLLEKYNDPEIESAVRALWRKSWRLSL